MLQNALNIMKTGHGKNWDDPMPGSASGVVAIPPSTGSTILYQLSLPRGQWPSHMSRAARPTSRRLPNCHRRGRWREGRRLHVMACTASARQAGCAMAPVRQRVHAALPARRHAIFAQTSCR